MDDPQTTNRRDGHDRSPDSQQELEDALRRAISARVEAHPAGLGHGPAVIADLAAARARRRVAMRTGLATAAAVALVVGFIGWSALRDDSGSTVIVAAPGDGDPTQAAASPTDSESAGAAAGDAAPTAAADGAGTPAGSEPAPSPAATDPAEGGDPVATAAQPEITVQALSTGPPLRWTEIEPAFWDLWSLQSLSDGRVLGFASHNEAQWPQIDTREVTVVTDDGVNWTEVNLPAEVLPHHIAVSGDRWVVGGPDRSSSSFFDGESRVFVSNDATATWTELQFEEIPLPTPVSAWIEHRTVLTSVLASGDDIVLILGASAALDVQGLVEASGLLPEGRSALGWSYGGAAPETSGSLVAEISVTLGDSDAGEQTEPAALEYADDGADFSMGETMQFSAEELGLTAEEQDALFNEPRSLVLLWSDGYGVGEPVEVTTVRETLGALGAATEDGFVVHLLGPSEGSILTSADGRTWIEEPYDAFGLFGAVMHRGAFWSTVVEPSATSLKRTAPGSEPQTVTSFEGLDVGQLHAGRGGLVATAMPAPPVSAYEEAVAAAMSTVRISSGGYELRYDEPPGGLTLWDLSAEEPVRVFDAEELSADEPIEGVREEADETGVWVTFIDPDTGEDLVTFSPEDFEAAFEVLSAQETSEPGASQPLTADSGYWSQENWVGWSADGASWGWQTMTETFGVGADAAWVEYGIGHDFVIAAVQPFGTPPVPAPDGSDALVAEPRSVRVFLAPLS